MSVEALLRLAKPTEFRYRIDQLRVDGDRSADPRDYRHAQRGDPVGRALHAFLTAQLPARLIRPGASGTVEWELPQGRIVVLRPTVVDLRLWARATHLRYHGCERKPTPILKTQAASRP